jgi:glycosyltransferase involved in cell wall biosynthesis
MQHALTDEGFERSLRERGVEQARRFSWDNSAKKAIEAFEEVHKSSRIAGDLKAFDFETSYNDLLTSIAEIRTTVAPTTVDLLRTASSIAIDTPVPGSRQLLVDISELILGDTRSGIQRVVRSILVELLRSPPPGYRVEPVYFDDQRYHYAHCFVNTLLGLSTGILEDDVVNAARGDTYLGLDLSLPLTPAVQDYLKQLNIVGVNVDSLVYDTLPTLHPEWWPEGMGTVFRQWLASIAEVSTGLICISHSVADDVSNWLDAHPPDRVEPLPIGFFHLGADIENSFPTTGIPEDGARILAALAAAPSFLMVGTVEPRKRHAQALSAFEMLWEEGHEVNLVIVGKRGWMVEDLVRRLSNHPMLGKRLFWLEGISDEYLEKIYAASTCLVAASEAEGFGLPLIEAARKGLPIIARDIPVFREVAGEHAFYFGGLSPEDLARAVRAWLDLSSRGEAPSSQDMPWLTWKESTAQLVKLVLPA